MDTEQFGSLLQEQSTDFQAAEELGLRWYPANEGEYVCVISSIKRRIYKKKGVSIPLWNFALQLLEGEEAGQEMSYVITGEGELGMGRVKATASTLQGSKFTGDLPTANAVFEKAFESKVPLLCKYERKAKEEGQEGYWDNIYINKILSEIPSPQSEARDEVEQPTPVPATAG